MTELNMHAAADDGRLTTSGTGDDVGDGAATLKQIRKEQRRLLYRSPGFIIGVLILVFWVVAAISPSLITERGPKEQGIENSAGEQMFSEGPNGDAWFGTDRLGQDVFARVVYGARPIMITAPLATAFAVAIGTLIGLITGYFGGWIDEILSRLLEAILAIPAILLAIVIIFTFGPTRPVIIGTIAFLFIPPVARTVRASTISEARLDYVTSAKMRGESSLFILTREILPNISGVVVVEATVRIAYAIFTLATLAFLGLSGGNATDAEWGRDVANNYPQIGADVWWPTIFPALAITSLVIGVNLVADSFQKAFES